MPGDRFEPLSEDEALDRAIDAALDVEPRPDFAAGVRTRIASGRHGWMAWPIGAAGLAAAAVLIAVMWMPRSPFSTGGGGASAPRVSGAEAPPLQAPPLQVPPPQAPTPEAPTPQVLVAKDEMDAFRRFLTTASQGRLRELPVPAMEVDPDTGMPRPPPLVIEPIHIEPLEPTGLDIDEGEAR